MKKRSNIGILAVFILGLFIPHFTSVFASQHDDHKQKKPSTTYKINQPDGSKVTIKVKSNEPFKVNVKQTYKGQKITVKPVK
ncbi:MAG: hypothetical protein ACK5TR_01995 [Alphaproteobacteria bacterium]|jgi:hypothetical protein|nr:hypothetical protein [Alphaproteobacteria bacterium]